MREALADRYAVERELGQGGTAIVYLAQDLRHSRPVAIKVLRPELAAVVGAERFLREIETVARLQHPHILPLYDSGEAAGILFFVMPYVAGDTLRDRLEREKQLAVDDAIAITRDVASALSFAHSQDVVHRDIKPENILMFSGKAVVADFGIAHSIRVAGTGRMTDAGLALGTPMYMSPEQAAASGEIDARSDIYSLGCVLYEMLAGKPPFSGFSAMDLLSHHLHDPPRPLSELRSSVPPALTLAVARALAKLPADRYRTVAEFAEAVRVAADARRPIPMPLPKRALVWSAAVLVIAVLLIVVFRPAGAAVDPALHIVFPFADRTRSADSADATRMPDALAYKFANVLKDFRVVDCVSAMDAWRLTPGTPSLDKVVSAATRAGAGRAIWGDVSRSGDSITVNVALYDVKRRGAAIRSASAVIGLHDATPAALAAPVAELLARLLLESAPPLSPDRWIGTGSLAALDAFADGFKALGDWHLKQARARFQAAVDADPGYAQAQLWLALTDSWSGDQTPWRAAARAAGALAPALLTFRDSSYALGLRALADSQYTDACDRYRALIARDSADAIAHFGLGECLRRDDAVVPSAASPTGFAFRTSIEAAARAYRRAFMLAPSFNYAFGTDAYGRAARAMFAEPNWWRTGRRPQDPTATFRAFSGLDADTLVFVPYPEAEVAAGRGVPPSHHAAVVRSQAMLRAIAEQWVLTASQNPVAHAALANALERDGLVGGTDNTSALAEIRLARARQPDSIAGLSLARVQVRLLLKAGDAEGARALADSLLVTRPGLTPATATVLAPLAALLGRVRETADLYALAASDDPLTDPTTGRAVNDRDLVIAVARFNAFVGFGAPRESVAVGERAVRRLIERAVPANARERLRYVLLGDGGVFGYQQLGIAGLPPAQPGDYMAPMLFALSRGDTAEVRRRLRRLDVIRAEGTIRPGDLAILTSYHETLIYLSLRDSLGAAQHLGAVLDGFALSGTGVLNDPLSAATLVRAWALRARLALAAHDTATAERNGRTVRILWQDASPWLSGELAGLPGVRR